MAIVPRVVITGCRGAFLLFQDYCFQGEPATDRCHATKANLGLGTIGCESRRLSARWKASCLLFGMHHGDDDIALLVTLIDIPMGLGHLL